MFPTRGNNFDYVNEVQRLFSRPENDNRNYNPNVSPFSQAVNRSSSSADSTSPESYMSTDIGPNTSMYSPLQSHRRDLDIRSNTSMYSPLPSPRQDLDIGSNISMYSPLQSPRQDLDIGSNISMYSPLQSPRQDLDIGSNTSMYSPLQSPRQDLFKRQVPNSPSPSVEHSSTPTVKRQRPIIGRQIITNFDRLPVSYEPPVPVSPMMKEDFSNQRFWQPDESVIFQQTPQNNTNYFMENKNYQPNVFYELFPSDNRGIEFRTPIKISPTLSSVSPNQSSISSMTAHPQNTLNPLTSQNFRPINLKKPPSMMPNNPRYNQVIKQQKMCTFCRKNGETPVVYMTHTVKEKVGNKWIVTCPILRSHICSTCGASGDDAHTITYCPVLRSCNNGLPLQSTTITLKNTRVLSNGRRRY